jgi:Sec-independent protein translocase protein TatA
LVILIIIFVIFESRLKSAFSDVGYILDIEEKRQQYDREKKKEEKEERERQKKSLKKGKANKSEGVGNLSQSSEEQE